MNPDVLVWLDGKKVRLGDVPEDRLPDVEIDLDGGRVRPYRFHSIDETPFRVIR